MSKRRHKRNHAVAKERRYFDSTRVRVTLLPDDLDFGRLRERSITFPDLQSRWNKANAGLRRRVWADRLSRAVHLAEAVKGASESVRSPLSFSGRLVQDQLRKTELYRAMVCAKRKIRREVMFARLVAGRGGSGARKPRRVDADSKVRC